MDCKQANKAQVISPAQSPLELADARAEPLSKRSGLALCPAIAEFGNLEEGCRIFLNGGQPHLCDSVEPPHLNEVKQEELLPLEHSAIAKSVIGASVLVATATARRGETNTSYLRNLLRVRGLVGSLKRSDQKENSQTAPRFARCSVVCVLGTA